MKNRFKQLKGMVLGEWSMAELIPEIESLVSDIVESPEDLYYIDKYKSGYGTWRMKGFINKAYFGEELTEILRGSISTGLTHDEDREFTLADFEEDLQERILQHLTKY